MVFNEVLFEFDQYRVVVGDFSEDLLLAFELVLRRDLSHELDEFLLSLLGRMRVVDVLVDLGSQIPLQVQIEHRSVGQVHFLLEVTRIFRQLFSITRHVADKHGIGDCAHCKQGKGDKELHGSLSWHDLTYTEQVESGVESDEVGAVEVRIIAFRIFPVRLVGSILVHIHEVHVLDPTLLLRYNVVPATSKEVQGDEDEEEHPRHLKVDLDVLGSVRLSDDGRDPSDSQQFQQTKHVQQQRVLGEQSIEWHRRNKIDDKATLKIFEGNSVRVSHFAPDFGV